MKRQIAVFMRQLSGLGAVALLGYASACVTTDDAVDAGVVADAAQPESGAQALLQWLLDAVASGEPPTAAEIEQNVAPNVLAAIAPDVLIAGFAQLSTLLSPFELSQLRQTSDTSVLAQLETNIGPWTVSLQSSATTPPQITNLLLQPSRPLVAGPTTFTEAVAQLEPMASVRELLFAEIIDGACTPIQQLSSSMQPAIGSAFKLWVLHALDTKLRDDPKLGWDSKLAIRDELKSLPPGVSQDLAAGTERTLRELAQDMISISDNTASDHLIDFCGRSAVERAQEETGHSEPAVNVPWLYTREMFALKGWAAEEQLQAFRSGTMSEKLGLLDELRAEPLEPDIIDSWTTPRSLDLEWFASAMDVCRAYSALASRGGFDPSSELLKILATNSGGGFDLAKWSYIGFKGGSEPGVFSISWLLQRGDGRWFSIVLTVNDATRAIDEAAVTSLASGLAPILEAEVP